MQLPSPQWSVHDPPPESFAEAFPEFTPVQRQLLWNRGIHDHVEVERFLSPNYHADLHSPWLFTQMERAVERILRAIEQNESIVIYGDYDADGVCGTAILVEVLWILGVEPDVMIPHRNDEGHGLHVSYVEECVAQDVSLLITVDCGSTSTEAITVASSCGIDVIVIDHHEVAQDVPPSYAMVNPRASEERYPFQGLAGTGVAFKVIQALLERSIVDSEEREHHEKWLLDRVAIATIADMMPLRDENRTMTRFGLVVLAQTKKPGLRALMNGTRVRGSVSVEGHHKAVSADDVAFRLAPRLNAASRMEHAQLAFELVTSNDTAVAEDLARRLDTLNRERQRETERVRREIEERLAGRKRPVVIVESSPHWPIGLAGLAAGQLAERYGCPVFIIEERQEESLGSARSADKVHLVEVMETGKALLSDFGGHAAAAGFRLPTECIPQFRAHLEKMFEDSEWQWTTDTDETVKIDMALSPAAMTLETVSSIAGLTPFGIGNPVPLFLLEGWEVVESRMVGARENHCKLWLQAETDDGIVRGVDAIMFRFSGERPPRRGECVDVVGRLEENSWQGEVRLQVVVENLL